ncbi:hypothetical protein HOP50_03g25670 [Chloropicon primus]|uniref:Glycosyltransferase n=2 Tax=Chloropicon primus TaxID=1764295 RepID=A0A5B8MH70_9CHLO|nr:hypothetical protein A3770_03p25660 [Chloropicon primus]UPQ99260.1 hypothetical protein HOP50_03g25670 [Chloropicon primus]|eukprot:QDZ20048.1 hypothetical protein A3770_03p25660 [Chloropicon primus]
MLCARRGGYLVAWVLFACIGLLSPRTVELQIRSGVRVAPEDVVALLGDDWFRGERGTSQNASADGEARCVEVANAGPPLLEERSLGPGAPAPPIPQSIHFLQGFREDGGAPAAAGGLELPQKYLDAMREWKQMNPSSCVVRHEPKNIVELLSRRNATGWMSLFASYGHYIQKCDVSRYILMFLEGGVYTDVDIGVKRDLGGSTWLKYPAAKVFLGTERIVPEVYGEAMAAHKIRNGTREHPVRVANFWMMSEPGHKFWQHVMGIASARARLPVAESYDILYTTGPDLLTEAYHTFDGEDGEIVLLDREEFAALLHHDSDGHWRSNFTRIDLLVYARMIIIIIQRFSLGLLLHLFGGAHALELEGAEEQGELSYTKEVFYQA